MVFEPRMTIFPDGAVSGVSAVCLLAGHPATTTPSNIKLTLFKKPVVAGPNRLWHKFVFMAYLPFAGRSNSLAKANTSRKK
jgi:hypothetical protein